MKKNQKKKKKKKTTTAKNNKHPRFKKLNLGYFYAVYKSVSRFDHTHIASDLGEMARRSRDGGVQFGGIRAHRIKNEPLFSQRLKSFVLFKVSFEGFKFFFKNCGKSFAKLSIELFNALCLFVPKVFINIKNLLKRFK